METKIDSRNIIEKDSVNRVAKDATPSSPTQLDQILRSINSQITPPWAVTPTGALQLTVAPGGSVDEEQGFTRSASEVNGAIPDLDIIKTVQFPASATGANITTSTGDSLPLTLTFDTEVAILLSIDKNGSLFVKAGVPTSASAPGLSRAALKFDRAPAPDANTMPLAYIVVSTEVGNSNVKTITFADIYQVTNPTTKYNFDSYTPGTLKGDLITHNGTNTQVISLDTDHAPSSFNNQQDNWLLVTRSSAPSGWAAERIIDFGGFDTIAGKPALTVKGLTGIYLAGLKVNTGPRLTGNNSLRLYSSNDALMIFSDPVAALAPDVPAGDESLELYYKINANANPDKKFETKSYGSETYGIHKSVEANATGAATNTVGFKVIGGPRLTGSSDVRLYNDIGVTVFFSNAAGTAVNRFNGNPALSSNIDNTILFYQETAKIQTTAVGVQLLNSLDYYKVGAARFGGGAFSVSVKLDSNPVIQSTINNETELYDGYGELKLKTEGSGVVVHGSEAVSQVRLETSWGDVGGRMYFFKDLPGGDNSVDIQAYESGVYKGISILPAGTLKLNYFAGGASNDLGSTPTGLLGNFTSDERLKKDITPWKKGKSTIKKVEPISWRWIEGEDDNLSFGYSAQNLIKAGLEEAVYKDKAGNYALNRTPIMAANTNAINDLIDDVDNIHLRLKQIEEKLLGE